MKIHLVSDLHLEFGPYVHPAPEGTDVIIAAGDITAGPDAPMKLRKIFGESIPIVYIAGNHEHYGFEIKTNMFAIRNVAEQYNVHFLDNEWIEIDKAIFVGGTLWTNYCLHGEPYVYGSMRAAQACVNDFRRIKIEKVGVTRKLQPSDTLAMHEATIEHFKLVAKMAAEDGKKLVVVSHMAPHPKSIHKRYSGAVENPYYASDLEKEIDTMNPVLWVHGHMHDSFDYKVYDTRVVCNPRGYVSPAYDRKTNTIIDQAENSKFNPTLLLEI